MDTTAGQPPLTSGAPFWSPQVGATFQVQYSTPVDLSVEADIFDIDMFDNDAPAVSALHAKGAKVMGYISVGSWEDWRPDAHLFPNEVLGKDYSGWPGERWLDIRRIDLLQPIMLARLDLAKAKGFDGVEPDNMDGYLNDTGFPLTEADQLTYNLWLANEAHARGLAIAQKNDGPQTTSLLPAYDLAIVEECFAYQESGLYKPYTENGKAVCAIEYRGTLGRLCPKAAKLSFSLLIKRRSMNAWFKRCP